MKWIYHIAAFCFCQKLSLENSDSVLSKSFPWPGEVSESVSIKMCFTIIIKITLIFHPKAPRLGIVAEYKLRRLFTKNWETLGGEHANLPSSSSSRLRWKENWKLQISCQSQTVWTRRLMTGANITQFQTKSSLSPWPQASQERQAILYRLIEELITSELIYRFLWLLCNAHLDLHPDTSVQLWFLELWSPYSTEARGRAARIFCIFRGFANTGCVTVVIMMVWMMMVMVMVITAMIDNDGDLTLANV